MKRKERKERRKRKKRMMTNKIVDVALHSLGK